MNDKLAKLEEALDILYDIDPPDGELGYDLREVFYSLSKLIEKFEADAKEKENVTLAKWINGNEDWQRWQPQMASDSVFHSKRRG